MAGSNYQFKPFSKMNKKEKAEYRHRRRMQQIAIKKKIEDDNLRRVREISAGFTETAPAYGAVGIGVKIPTKSTRKTYNSHKKRNGISAQNYDPHDLASQDMARNIEYGHGRRKSDEWNNKAAVKLNKEIEELKKMRFDDPNQFDRQAMK